MPNLITQIGWPLKTVGHHLRTSKMELTMKEKYGKTFTDQQKIE